jgi:hypothetical protein
VDVEGDTLADPSDLWETFKRAVYPYTRR